MFVYIDLCSFYLLYLHKTLHPISNEISEPNEDDKRAPTEEIFRALSLSWSLFLQAEHYSLKYSTFSALNLGPALHVTVCPSVLS